MCSIFFCTATRSLSINFVHPDNFCFPSSIAVPVLAFDPLPLKVVFSDYFPSISLFFRL